MQDAQVNLRYSSWMLYNKESGANGTAWHCYVVLLVSASSAGD
ncbi:MAG TPA: hypothetical protein VL461_01910 [Dictyobacter sp.]|nr:hypothetical protein [Dictyobacter sp.]